MSNPATRSVVVVGGGITGLVAARNLVAAGVRVTLVEEQDQLGGKIRTKDVDGALVEAGADWFITRAPDAVDLCRELGLGDDLVPPAVVGASVWSGGKLHPLPGPLVRGVPASPAALIRSDLVSRPGRVRALLDLVMPGRVRGPDVAIGPLVRRRLGDEILERLVDPMLAAARAGRADELSLAAAAPDLDAIARTHRSLMMGARAELRAATSADPPFLGLRTGMGALIERLAGDLGGADVRTGERVTGLQEKAGSFVVSIGDEAIAADGVVLAIPAFAAAPLVKSLNPVAAEELAAIEYASGAVIALVYPSDPSPDLPGSGFLVPSAEKKVMTACAWFSRKWGHAAHPRRAVVMRCFVGRAADEGPLDPADILLDKVDAELRAAVGLTRPPIAFDVTRWERGLPQYAVGHLERVERVRGALSRWPAIAMGGAGYWGSGIPDCIRQGRDAATQVVAALGISRAP